MPYDDHEDQPNYHLHDELILKGPNLKIRSQKYTYDHHCSLWQLIALAFHILEAYLCIPWFIKPSFEVDDFNMSSTTLQN